MVLTLPDRILAETAPLFQELRDQVGLLKVAIRYCMEESHIVIMDVHSFPGEPQSI
jgi:hypothetical protein